VSNAGEWGFTPLENPSQNPVDIAKQAAYEIAVAESPTVSVAKILELI
jgi:purine-nucleoside phosphorylase